MKLELTEANAILLYQEANDAGKQRLVLLFGEAIFNQKIIDRVKSYQDACNVLSAELAKVKADNKIANDAIDQMEVITRALNGREVTVGDRLYYPVFIKAPFGLSYSCTDYWGTNTYCGARLGFLKKEHADYAGEKFLEIYKLFLLPVAQ